MDMLTNSHQFSSSEIERRMYIEGHPLYTLLFEREEPVPELVKGMVDAAKSGTEWLGENQVKMNPTSVESLNALVSNKAIVNYYHDMLLTANINNFQLMTVIQKIQLLGNVHGSGWFISPGAIVADLSLKPYVPTTAPKYNL